MKRTNKATQDPLTESMKGTKVLTLGAGRAPQHGGYKDVYNYIHAL